MSDEELVKRPLDEEFDTMMEVQRNPCGAWQAIQTLTEQLEAARADAKEAEAYAEELEAKLAEVEKERDELRAAKWVVKHTDTMNDMVQMGMARDEALATVATLTAQVEAMRGALIAEREENLWNAYNTGYERDGRWSHAFMSDGEWLAHECGFDARDGDYPADAIKAAIPEAAKRAALAAYRKDHEQRE